MPSGVCHTSASGSPPRNSLDASARQSSMEPAGSLMRTSEARGMPAAHLETPSLHAGFGVDRDRLTLGVHADPARRARGGGRAVLEVPGFEHPLALVARHERVALASSHS